MTGLLSRAAMALGAVTLALGVSAAPLTPQQALSRLMSQSSVAKIKRMPSSKEAIKLHSTISNTDGSTALVYLFDKGEGYALLSADDRFPALLGYSDKGTLSTDSVAPALRYMMGEYAREMEYVLNNSEASSATVTEAPQQWQAVEPMMKSQWNQDAPFNLYSPKMIVINSTTGEPTGQEIETPAGCVATAMAQVMYFHRWPDVGVGSNSYLWQTYADVKSQTLSCDFSQTPFAWDKMRDTYTLDSKGNPTWTTEEGEAVGKLLYACGIAVNMKFNAAQVGGSGAYSKDLALSLIKNFKYSKSMRMEQRDYTSNAAFEELIYGELAQGYPVIYDGRGSGGGHCFVCDGYSGNHYFHFNWGWGGTSDGYFYLGRLNPETLGIGGGSGGFNYTQSVVYGIRPVKDGNDTAEMQSPYLRCVGNFDFSSASGTTTSFVIKDATMGYAAGMWNLSLSPFTGYLGLAILDTKGNGEFVACLDEKGLEPYQGRTALQANLTKYTTPGEYGIYPAFYSTDTKKVELMKVANGFRSYVVMTVAADGTRSFANANRADEVSFAPELQVSCFSYNGAVYAGAPKQFMISLTNLSNMRDYYGDLTMIIRDSKNRERASIPVGRYDVAAGMSYPLSFTTTFNILENEYNVVFRDAYGRTLPGVFPLNITGTLSPLTTQLRVTGMSPVEIKPSSTVPQLLFTLTNTGSAAVAQPTLGIQVFKLGATSPTRAWSFNYGSLSVPAGATYTLAVGNLPFNLAAGDYEVKFIQRKAVGLTYTDIVISQPIALRVGNPVTDVKFSANEAEIEVSATLKIEPTFTPANATFTSLQWVSSNPEVATVDNNGTVTGIAAGEAYITAGSYNAHQDVCRVTVKPTSGITEIIDGDTPVTAIYRLDGTKLPTVSTADLAPGIYIVRQGTRARKVAVN